MATKLAFAAVAILMSMPLNEAVANILAAKKPSVLPDYNVEQMTARELAKAFEETLKDENEALEHEVFVESQRKPKVQLVQPHVPTTASSASVPVQLHAVPLSSTASEFEKDVTDLVMGLSKAAGGNSKFMATPMGSTVTTIKKLIETDMMKRVQEAHDKNQKELTDLGNTVTQCSTTKVASLSDSVVHTSAYQTKSPDHKECRQGEAGFYTQAMACHQEWKTAKAMKKLECQAFEAVQTELGSTTTNQAIAEKATGETVEVYVNRLHETFCGGDDGKGGYKDKFSTAKNKCEKAKKDYDTKDTDCKKIDTDWADKKKVCNAIQQEMDEASCKAAIETKDTCESYAECHESTIKAYQTAEVAIRPEEVDRKAEWKGLKRMLCLIVAFEDGAVTDAEVTNCKNADHQAEADSKFTLDYFVIPSLEPCAVSTKYPGSVEYKKEEFEGLPTFAKGNLDALSCAGITSISTIPADGSPASCKCERVTLNGPYTPGALVKCTNCKEVSRSTDAISCPVGTKLFAPTSKEDWDTFLGSAGPLRNPHWIVDVTRPQNGCGGCTGNPMNSGNAAQSSWKTSDGAAWWLRDSNYGEPNGDYHANCYLDLWHDPADSSSITFNDGSCGYRSKDYYCQSEPLSLTPAEGSPAGCLCHQVALVGAYTAKNLLKCENCLDVYKSTQKNSCPRGTKLWAPASAEDWKTFLASADKVAAPNWIIDVTRPQNGCGGCTGNAMNSGNAAQSSWETSDGAPWWLRSSNYNEPNGDYHANCYLDLWHSTPATEHAVVWNDGSCSYHSKSYYCQGSGARPSATTTTTLPPWAEIHGAVAISTTPAEGSPSSCECSKLELKGSYSAGAILKCQNCLDVYKTTQKNSCPDGTKLFSPSSKADWETFFSSGGSSIRSPHWIIDVTRPQNGCGGCTGNPMKSTNAAQSSWKTTDGAAWWMRDQTYGEPNGDYTANCYLDLWNSPSSASNIVFNDGSCGYHSKSYYCQPKTVG